MINNDTYQRKTLSEQPIRQPLTLSKFVHLKILYKVMNMFKYDFFQNINKYLRIVLGMNKDYLNYIGINNEKQATWVTLINL